MCIRDREGTKDALATLQQWYAEGLIDPDIFTTDTSLKDQKFANSKGGIYEGSGFTGSPVQPETAALLAVTPTAKVAPIASIKGPNGDFGAQESAPGYGNIRAISSTCLLYTSPARYSLGVMPYSFLNRRMKPLTS